MLQAIGNNDLQNAYRDMLKAFYGALKSKYQYIQFPYYAHVQSVEFAFQIMSFIEKVEKGEIDAFFLRLQSFFCRHSL